MKIRKSLVLIVILLALSSVVYAGGISAKGVKVGLVISNFTGGDAEDFYETKVGFSAGGFLTYRINKSFAIQPELLFTTKGASAEIDEEYFEDGYYGNMKADATWNFSFIELPLLAKFSLAMGENLVPNFFFGPSFGFNIGARYKEDYDYTIKDENGEIIMSDSESDEGDITNVSSFEFGAVVGAGINFGKFSVDGRYNLGITSANDYDDVDIRHSVITFMVGYSL